MIRTTVGEARHRVSTVSLNTGGGPLLSRHSFNLQSQMDCGLGRGGQSLPPGSEGLPLSWKEEKPPLLGLGERQTDAYRCDPATCAARVGRVCLFVCVKWRPGAQGRCMVCQGAKPSGHLGVARPGFGVGKRHLANPPASHSWNGTEFLGASE